jgi:single-stranded DNA-specific DHH superfamily exonuclease
MPSDTKHDTLLELFKLIIEEQEEEMLDEFSGVGAIAGFTAPIGRYEKFPPRMRGCT